MDQSKSWEANMLESKSSSRSSGEPVKEKRGSIFRMPFRSKKTPSRAQSVSIESQPRSSSMDIPRSKLRGSVPNKNGVYVLEQRKSRGSADYPRVRLGDGFERDKQTGEVIDHTEMLHNLAQIESKEHVPTFVPLGAEEGTESGESVVDNFPPRVWQPILAQLSIADIASVAFTCKAFQKLVGTDAWGKIAIAEEPYRSERLSFLPRLDRQLPNHLLCFDCGVYHLRTQRGHENLRPTNVLNPVYECPNMSNPKKIYPRIRLTFGRALPLTFLQLAMRAHRFSLDYGIKIESLSKRYKDKEEIGQWSHQTRYAVVNGKLMMRVISQTFAAPGLPPAGERHLLYSREDFVPFFSVCPHWRDGVLMPNVKCAIRHIPKPPEGSGLNRVTQDVKLHFHPTNPIVTLCSECRPLRRCPECPTEYLIEVKMSEDKSDPTKLFKQALVVTRWSDLGDGTSPFTPEWSACCGAEGFDSVAAIGKRAVSGLFEAELNSDVIPGQNMLSLNPDKMKLGEAGHEWY